MSATHDLTRAMLRPEDVDDFRSLVLEVLSLRWAQRESVEAFAHHLARRDPCPRAALPMRAATGVEGHDLRLYFCLDVGEQRFDLGLLHFGELCLHNEPRDRVQ